ncbi:MAG TPA: histidinol dehydrogenase [Methanocellales archaeon]|nr:histidinol dehydrogenase [Methanocellales archaeon]
MIIKRLSELSDTEIERLVHREIALQKSMERVKSILADVQEKGDAALIKYTKEFDGVELKELEVTEEEMQEAERSLDKELIRYLESASINIATFHGEQLKEDLWLSEFAPGMLLGQKTEPLERVGAYVPGGSASYPSTALMTVIPARVAGVEDVIVCTPPKPDGKIDPLTLVATNIAGADSVYKVGGAQSIAAMAYGTETIPKVDKIVGPGNVYVTAAKMLVRNEVEIDFPAGPSEVMILADQPLDKSLNKKASIIASDMVAQAEHDPRSLSVLITTSDELAKAVSCELKVQGKKAQRNDVIAKALERSAILTVNDLEEGIEFVNKFAPEHLELMISDALSVLKKIKHAGSIFIGDYSPVAGGDYAYGTNHVLPTGGYARVLSGLNVDHFTKKTSIQILSKEGLDSIKDDIIALARAEGLEAHADSIRKRFEE